MKKCPYCQAENEDQAKTCFKCKAGFPLETKKTDTESVRTKKKNKE